MFEFEFFVGIAGGVGIALIVWSLTELARITADHSGWHFNEKDELTKTAGGERIAFTIEDAAAAMQDLGWLIPGAVSCGIHAARQGVLVTPLSPAAMRR